jgi:hypothetical protein
MPLTPSFAKLRVKAERCSLSEARKGVDRLQSAMTGRSRQPPIQPSNYERCPDFRDCPGHPRGGRRARFLRDV